MRVTPEHNEVQAELGRILASKQFRKARRLSDLLRFIVSEYIKGQASNLKEVAIGVALFDCDYDPAKVSPVRTAAGRLRRRLVEYYSAEGADDPWIITISKEGYVPRIIPGHFERDCSTKTEPRV
jgi:hypothetical protein